MSDVTGAGTAVAGGLNATATIIAAQTQAEAAKYAANRQADTANRAADLVQGRYNTTREDFEPYRGTGINANKLLSDNLGKYIDTENPYANELRDAMPVVPAAMTQSELEATPGYQFTLSQGLRATQNAQAARGLGVSGAAMKGAAGYATGLSDQTYNTRFNQQQALFGNQQTRFSDVQTRFTDDQGLLANSFNRLNGLVTLGQNSAAQTGKIGSDSANAAGGFIADAGRAGAAGILGTANATSGMFNGLANSFSQYNAQNALSGYRDADSMYGGGSGYSRNQLSAINNGAWSAADERAASSYDDMKGY